MEILYEDNDVLVLNKPAGILMHTDGSSNGETVADWIEKTYPDSKGVGEKQTLKNDEEVDRSGIVHRLDRDTSGVVILAKTQDAFLFLKEQFQSNSVEKKYHAFVHGVLKEKKGIIDRPIGRSSKQFNRWSAQRGARGTLRDAVTEYSVLEESNGVSYVEVRPRTGRTHQIRVHLKAVNHPIVADSLYAPNHDSLLGFDRQALHASTLSLMLPNGKKNTFEAPLPKDFEMALTTFRSNS